MKASTQPGRGRSIWTSRRFDQRVEFDAGELRQQPDFAPPREPSRSDSYARHFYGDRAAPSKAHPADEGLSDVVAVPRRGAAASKAVHPRRRRA